MNKSIMHETVVVKFGGSVLQDEGAIQQAAELIQRTIRGGLSVVVVVSAMKGVTDGLMELSKKVDPDMDPSVLDELLSSGEKSSARLVAASLAKHSVSAVVVEPDSPSWPVITDDRHLDANPIFDATKERVEKYIVPLLRDGKVPVVCGFLGKTRHGKTTTLGRGGSDTTAVLLGSCLGAREVVLIKDIEGVYTSDPDRVANAHFVEALNGEEAGMLAAGGAKFLHQKALRYQQNGLRVRLTNLGRSDSGTIIEGDLPEAEVDVSSTDVSMITVVGVDSNRMESFARLVSAVKESGASIPAISLESRSAILYVAGGTAVLDAVHRVLVEENVGKAVSSFENLAMITVKGRALEIQPGIVQRVTQPLARSGINLFGVVTILSSVRVFVSLEHSERAIRLIKEALAMSEA